MSSSVTNEAPRDPASSTSKAPSLLGLASIVVGAGAGAVGLAMLGYFYVGEIVSPGGLTDPSNIKSMEFAAIAFTGVFLGGIALGLTPLIRDRRKDTAAILGVLVNVFGIASLVGLAVIDFLFY